MEREGFFTGYCRQADESRMVSAEAEGATLLDVTCGYANCPYTDRCTIAQKIREFLEQ